MPIPPNTRAAALLLACLPLAVQAQGLGGLVADTGLKSSDHAMMREAGARLYTVESPAVGATEDWSNEETGARGRVELTGFDGECAELHHVFQVRNRATDQFRSRRCRTPEGAWQIAPE